MKKGKFRILEDGILAFYCLGCKQYHGVHIDGVGHPIWGFNGDYDKPTFTPSILVRGTVPITDEEADRIMQGEKISPIPFVCHSFVRDGKIQFLSDCTHELAGQTVELEEEEE